MPEIQAAEISCVVLPDKANEGKFAVYIKISGVTHAQGAEIFETARPLIRDAVINACTEGGSHPHRVEGDQ